MLKKLLKYDLQNIFKVIGIYYILAIIFGVLTRVFFRFENSLIMEILGQIAQGTAISMMCSTLINNILRMWVRFKSHFYGDESYLTHTLPIEKHTHYLSKFLTTVITLFTSFIVVFLVLLVMYYSKENLQWLKSILLPIAEMYDSSILGMVAAFVFVLFLEFLNILQCGFTGIILGHKISSAKVGFSVLFGGVVYMASQTIVLLILFAVAIFNSDFMNLFITNSMPSIETIKGMIFLSIFSYTFVSVLLCFINIRLFKKGVNVD